MTGICTRILIGACLALLVGLAANAQSGEDPAMVVFHTNHGDIHIELFEQAAPRTTDNFRRYVESGFYDGTVFHRVKPGFVIQGGGYDEQLRRKRPLHEPIHNESDNGLENERGTLSMARTADAHSATSQFFINLSDNASLDYRNGGWGYAVFGRVVDGMDVVDEIAAIPTRAAGPFRQDVPEQSVVIESAEAMPE